MSDFVISQTLVGFAILLDTASFQFKKREHVLFILFVSGGFIGFHFYLLEQYTPSALILISMTRYLLSIFWTTNVLKYLFLSASLTATLFTYSGVISILAFCGTTCHTFGAFSPDNKVMRLWMVLGTLLWIVHNFIVWTPMGVLMEVLFLGSNLLGYYRLYLKNQHYSLKSSHR